MRSKWRSYFVTSTGCADRLGNTVISSMEMREIKKLRGNEAAIDEYIDLHNESPKPFIWTAKAADILEKVKRARAVLNLQSA